MVLAHRFKAKHALRRQQSLDPVHMPGPLSHQCFPFSGQSTFILLCQARWPHHRANPSSPRAHSISVSSSFSTSIRSVFARRLRRFTAIRAAVLLVLYSANATVDVFVPNGSLRVRRLHLSIPHQPRRIWQHFDIAALEADGPRLFQSVSGSALARQQHWESGGLENPPREVAESHLSHPAATVATHNEEIGVQVGSGLQQNVCRLTANAR